ncbi:hypothetical protein ACLB2K_016611 [Fragaria x ananassa]
MDIILNVAVEQNFAAIKAKVTMDCDYNLFTWKKPSDFFFKLNVDGSRSSTSEKISAGGVLRDQNGIWITYFQVNLGIGAIVDAEALGIYYGLKIASYLNIIQLKVESNSAIIMNLLHYADLFCHIFGSLIAGCHFLSSNMKNIKFSHIFREYNDC